MTHGQSPDLAHRVFATRVKTRLQYDEHNRHSGERRNNHHSGDNVLQCVVVIQVTT